MASELVCPRCQGTHCTRNGSSRGHRRFACRDCGRTFAPTVGTPLFRLRTPLPEIVRAILIVLRRGSLRAAEEQTDPPPPDGRGERWGCLSQDRASRFMVAWASGPREETLARTVVATTRRRTKGRVGIPYVTDGWEPYATTIKETYRDAEPSRVNPNWKILKPTAGIALTQAIKHRKGRRLERVEVRVVFGEPTELPYAVHLERLNGTLRDRLNCLTRKTHGFAKEVATWDALLGLALFEHNWLRPHVALRIPLPEPQEGRRYRPRSPAMAVGLTDHVWTWEEFLRRPVKPHV